MDSQVVGSVHKAKIAIDSKSGSGFCLVEIDSYGFSGSWFCLASKIIILYG